MVEFGIEFVPRNLYEKTIFYAVQAEKIGFDYLWIADHFSNRNVYISLAIISVHTKRIKLGPGITSPYLVHPIVTAQAVATLNEIAPCRVVCGIGAGDKTNLQKVGLERTKPLATIRESVHIIREITSGKNLEMQGEIFRVSGAKLNFKVANPIPIFIGAQGTRMLALAAEIGDGILINASDPKDVVEAMKSIGKGMKKARKKRDLSVGVYASLSVASDYERAFEAVVPVVAYIVAGSPEAILERHGIPVELAGKIRDSIVHARWKEAFSYVNDSMVEVFSICGAPETCVKKMDRLVKAGVNQLVVGSPIGPDMRKSMNMIAEQIFPHFKK